MTVIFVVPVFGVLWGTLFLDEAIHVSTVLGGAVILLSVWLITRARRAARPGARAGAARGVDVGRPELASIDDCRIATLRRRAPLMDTGRADDAGSECMTRTHVRT